MKDNILKLDSNENMIKHDADFVRCLTEVNPNLYPDVNITGLRSVLSEKFNVPIEEIFCSNGSDYLIKVLTFTLTSHVDEILIPEVAFPTYEIAAKIKECSYKLIPLCNHGIDLKLTLESISEKTKLIWISNPHNPTGTLLTQDELINFLNKVPVDIAVVLDEAYIDFIAFEAIDSIALYESYPNLIILRTLSKAFGIAGARVGFGFAKKNFMDKIRTMIGPFDLNSYAQRISIEAIGNVDYIERVRINNCEGISQYYQMCDEIGLKYVETYASFIIIETALSTELCEYLKSRNILIKCGDTIGLPGWVRISFGTVEQNSVVISEIKKFFKCR